MIVDLRFWNSIFRTKEQKKSNRRLWETDNFPRDKSNLIFFSDLSDSLWPNYLHTLHSIIYYREIKKEDPLN